jgi:hypothetical protein
MNKLRTINTIGANSVFTKTAIETQGDYTEMEALLPQCSREEIRHIHPLQTIELEALDGKLGIILPDRRLIIKPGQAFQIPKNMEHAFYNADEKPVRFKSILKPALHTEWLAKEIVAATHRKQSKWISTIEHSYILSQIKGEYYRSGVPIVLQKILHPLLANIAIFLGLHKKVRPVY